MSNRLAIAAVTLTLRNLIQNEIQEVLGGARVTMVPPDRAREGNNDADLINLFLYQTTPNASLRNFGMSGQTPRRGEQLLLTPLALNLHYLVSAYGADGNTANDHRLLGAAMKALHDRPLLDAEDIRAALAESELHNQVERLRITLESPSTEEMSKLWSTFQSQYRISVAYQVAVVLIDSTRAPKVALPVLRRGEEDRGFPAVATPFQSIDEVKAPHPFASARLGDDITITGSQLSSVNVVVRFSSRRLDVPIDRDPLPERSDSALKVRIPNNAAAADAWPPGLYTAMLVVKPQDRPEWTTNEVPFALAPRIAIQPANVAAGGVLTVTPTPHLRVAQREHAVLLIGDQQIRPRAAAAGPPPTDLQFVVPAMPAGQYVVRLRVDGVESLPFALAGVPPRLGFDAAQMVTVT